LPNTADPGRARKKKKHALLGKTSFPPRYVKRGGPALVRGQNTGAVRGIDRQI